MTGGAKSLLVKMASEYDNSNRKAFDSIFYLDYPDKVLIELEDNGYIIRENNIAATIKLTKSGYEAAKK